MRGAILLAGCFLLSASMPFAATAPYDLVFANILARPLMTMARDLSRALDGDGVVVLSGLLARQEAAVLAAHRLQHIFLRRRIAIDGWHSLILGRGRRAASLSDSETP